MICLAQGGNNKCILSKWHSLFHIPVCGTKCVVGESWIDFVLGSLLVKRYSVTKLNSEICVAEISAEKVLLEDTNNSKSRSYI